MLCRFLNVLTIPALLSVSGCALPHLYVPAEELAMCQLKSHELFAQTQELLAAQANAREMISGLHSEQQALNQRLSTANERVENLLTERAELIDRYADSMQSPHDESILTQFSSEVPGFEFDPVTGLYKFISDVQFDLGKAILRPEMMPVLNEFVAAVNSSGAEGNRILIVGHTDDLRIARGATASKHATNWHLSTNRADAVIMQLIRLGVDEQRMAAMGYSRFQPLEASTDEGARQRNRRVELYLVPSGGQVAQWDPVRALH
ncbi:MAG: OmpA family protein [Fuerstiella sp.]|nr:OmpA family protein [Fuerstiella sp.]